LSLFFHIYYNFFMDHSVFHHNHYGRTISRMMYLPILAFLLYFVAKEKYVLSVNGLLVGGAFGHKEEIYYSSITQVERIYNDGGHRSVKNIKWIRISHGKDESTNVAPVRMEEFLSKLESRIPNRQKYEEE